VPDIPAADGSGDGPLVRSLHRVVDIDSLAGVHGLELRARFRASVEVTIEVRLHRLVVLRIVVRAGALVTLEDLHDLGGERIAQTKLLGRPLIHARERRAEDEAD